MCCLHTYAQMVWSGSLDVLVLINFFGLLSLPVDVRDFRCQSHILFSLDYTVNSHITYRIGIKNSQRMSWTMRIELCDLFDSYPCFRKMHFSMMKEPFMDFSLWLGYINVSNLGFSNFNLGSWMQSHVLESVKGRMLYPKKYVYSMSKSEAGFRAQPEGLLQVYVDRSLSLHIFLPYIVAYLRVFIMEMVFLAIHFHTYTFCADSLSSLLPVLSVTA